MSGTFGKCLRSIWGAVGSNWEAFGELMRSFWEAFGKRLGSVWEAFGERLGRCKATFDACALLCMEDVWNFWEKFEKHLGSSEEQLRAFRKRLVSSWGAFG